MRKEIALSIAISLAVSFEGAAQVFLRYSTTEQEAWKEGKTKLSAKPASQHTVDIVGQGCAVIVLVEAREGEVRLRAAINIVKGVPQSAGRYTGACSSGSCTEAGRS